MPARDQGSPPTTRPAESSLDNGLQIQRIYDADREAMRAALRVALGLPKRLAGDEQCRN